MICCELSIVFPGYTLIEREIVRKFIRHKLQAIAIFSCRAAATKLHSIKSRSAIVN